MTWLQECLLRYLFLTLAWSLAYFSCVSNKAYTLSWGYFHLINPAMADTRGGRVQLRNTAQQLLQIRVHIGCFGSNLISEVITEA